MPDGDITIKIEGVGDVINALEAMKARLDVATRAATVKSGQTLQSKAVGNFEGTHAPGMPHQGGSKPNTVTGNLQRSIIAWPVVRQGIARYSVQINPTAIYSRIIELGGTITPKEKRYLSWISDTGKRVYRKQVTLRGWPYLAPATRDTAAVMNNIFESYWSGALHG